MSFAKQKSISKAVRAKPKGKVHGKTETPDRRRAAVRTARFMASGMLSIDPAYLGYARIMGMT